MKKFALWIAFAATTVVTGSAFGQNSQCRGSDNTASIPADHQFCFDPTPVNGAIPSPMGRGLGNRPRGLPVNLIRQRNNFVPQALKSVENL